MAAIRILLSGLSKTLREAIREDYAITLILTQPEADSGDITVAVETIKGGVTTTEDAGAITQGKFEAMLLPEGGAFGQTTTTNVLAATADLPADFAALFDAMEVDAGVAAGGAAAAVAAVLAPAQVAIAALIDGVLSDVEAALPPLI